MCLFKELEEKGVLEPKMIPESESLLIAGSSGIKCPVMIFSYSLVELGINLQPHFLQNLALSFSMTFLHFGQLLIIYCIFIVVTFIFSFIDFIGTVYVWGDFPC